MPHYRSIHYLRAVAALMIVLFHTYSLLPLLKLHAPSIIWLQAGVDIFFVISGFVMVASTKGRDVSPASFLARRLVRVAPLYWSLTFVLVLIVTGPTALARSELILPSLLFIPVRDPATGIMEPLLQPGWSLNLEVFFYAMFAVFLSASPRKQLVGMLSVLLLVFFVPKMVTTHDIFGFYSNAMIFEFWLGMMLAHFYRHAKAWMLPAGIAVQFFLHSYSGERFFVFGIGAFLIVAGAVAMEHRLRNWRLPTLLGDASYAIYLGHFLLLTIYDGAVGRYIHQLTALYAFIAFVLCIILGLMVHVGVEKPMTRFLNQIIFRKSDISATEMQVKA
jgi:exopolysaccharide production protein ExoZ